jgi:hypothetical protein
VAENQPSTKRNKMINQVTAGAMRPSEVLNVRRLPARLTVEQTASLLGFASHDIPILVRAKLLKPLGKPLPNATKWFATCEIEQYRNEFKWLDSAVKVLGDHWRNQNLKRRGLPKSSQQPKETDQQGNQ